MNTPALLFGCGLLILALYLFYLSQRDLGFRNQVKRLMPIQIRDIQPGLCLVEGTVESTKPIATPYSETPSVWFRYDTFERRMRKQGTTGMYDFPLGSGSRRRPFSLTENTRSIAVMPDGGAVVTYPHKRLFKSEFGKKTGVGARIKKMKDMEQEKYPEGEKKPFFRKMEVNAPLDIPDDLMELTIGSKEAEQAHRKYLERCIQPGDRMHVLGTAAMTPDGSGLRLLKVGKSPLIFSSEPKDLSAKSFQKNMFIEALVGIGSAALGVFLIMVGIGAV